jgi:prepilin-type N-terminal cleavage/methylation domain-containing protein
MSARRGFTLAEMMMTLSVSSIVLAIVARPATSYVNHTHANRAAIVLAGDLDLARSTAVRQREPVRIAFDSASASYTISSRNSGAVLRRRELGVASDFKLTTVSFSPAAIDVFPSGVSSAALTVTMGGNGFTRTVTMSRIGMVRAP